MIANFSFLPENDLFRYYEYSTSVPNNIKMRVSERGLTKLKVARSQIASQEGRAKQRAQVLSDITNNSPGHARWVLDVMFQSSMFKNRYYFKIR